MADATTVPAGSYLRNDNLFAKLQASHNALVGTDIPALRLLLQNRLLPGSLCPAIGQGSTAGKLRTNAAITYSIAGIAYKKASTDDLWALGALGTTAAAQYKAVPLYLDASGTATIGTLTAAAASDVAAQALMEAVPATKARIGFYVMGPSGNFANALDAQGTSYDGSPLVYDLTSYQVSWA